MTSTRRWDGRSRYREPEPTFDLGYVDDVPIEHDPLNPHPEYPTPIEQVLRLTRPQREKRVERLVEMAWERYYEAVSLIQADGKEIAAVCALTSGGNDSYTVAHIFRSVTTHQVHANTGTGIEATRQFVRDQARVWGVPLLEVHPKPGEGYFDLVRGKVMARSKKTGELVQAWPGGFPGPAAHAIMYTRLKERGLEQVPHRLGISGSRTQRALYIAGRRRPESLRRSKVPHFEIENKGTTPWSSPIAIWHKADLRAYRLMHGWGKAVCPSCGCTGVPRNPTAAKLGMSGECGCLANATPGEADRWRAAYPDDPFILEVNKVEAELAPRTDIPEHRKKWGWGAYYDEPDEIQRIDGLCSVNCGPDPIADAMDPLFDLDAEWITSGSAA